MGMHMLVPESFYKKKKKCCTVTKYNNCDLTHQKDTKICFKKCPEACKVALDQANHVHTHSTHTPQTEL